MILVNEGRKELQQLLSNTVLRNDSHLVDLVKFLDFDGDVYLGEMSSERPQKSIEETGNNI